MELYSIKTTKFQTVAACFRLIRSVREDTIRCETRRYACA